MALKRMDNVGIVVEDLGGAIDFYREFGLELEGRATIEGEWAGRYIRGPEGLLIGLAQELN
jgi:catechol 2,3-dioxygenase-like lactoylglutathione lyase family enzyme